MYRGAQRETFTKGFPVQPELQGAPPHIQVHANQATFSEVRAIIAFLTAVLYVPYIRETERFLIKPQQGTKDGGCAIQIHLTSSDSNHL